MSGQKKLIRIFTVDKLKKRYWWTRFRLWFWSKFGYCPLHGGKLEKYRMHTQYSPEKDNWNIGCDICQKECHDYYDELWKDYYSSR